MIQEEKKKTTPTDKKVDQSNIRTTPTHNSVKKTLRKSELDKELEKNVIKTIDKILRKGIFNLKLTKKQKYSIMIIILYFK